MKLLFKKIIFYITKNNTLASITIWKPHIINIPYAITKMLYAIADIASAIIDIASAVINIAPAIAKIGIANIDIISALRN